MMKAPPRYTLNGTRFPDPTAVRSEAWKIGLGQSRGHRIGVMPTGGHCSNARRRGRRACLPPPEGEGFKASVVGSTHALESPHETLVRKNPRPPCRPGAVPAQSAGRSADRPADRPRLRRRLVPRPARESLARAPPDRPGPPRRRRPRLPPPDPPVPPPQTLPPP